MNKNYCGIGEREIEFRAWDSREGKMINPCSLKKILSKLSDKLFNGTILDLIRGRPNDLIWMQCSSMKDKNGVKIFEGDIIRGMGAKEFGVVLSGEYEQDGSGGEYRTTACNGFYVKLEGVMDVFEECTGFNGSEWEVIGNVFENPELINQ